MSAALPVVALLLPVGAAGAIGLVRARPAWRDATAAMGALGLAACVLGLVPGVLRGESPAATLVEVLPGLSLALEVEPLGLIYALVASLLFVPTTAYSIGYVRATESRHQARYHACFALSMTCAVGIAFAANLFTLFVFYELMTLCTYPLVAHAGTQRAREGGRRYLTYLLGTSLSLLFAAIALTWSLAGTLDFRAGGTIGADLPTGVLVLLLGLFAFGFGKAALMPLHAWLPAAMVAPTPVSALLHAVAVVKAGVFAITKVIVFVLGTDTLAATGASDWLVAVAAAGLVLSGWIALRQDELKRRLAYSTVSQLAYVTLAAALATPLAVVGAAVQVAAHAVGKITLFFAAGSIQVATGRTKVSQLDGIARRMPITMTAFAIGSLSIIGLPPAAGLVGKWFILRGAFEADEPLAVAALAVGTLLSIGYLVPVLQAAFLREERVAAIETEVRVQEAPWPMTVAVAVTALLTVLLFLFPGPLLDVAALIAEPAGSAVAAGGAP